MFQILSWIFLNLISFAFCFIALAQPDTTFRIIIFTYIIITIVNMIVKPVWNKFNRDDWEEIECDWDKRIKIYRVMLIIQWCGAITLFTYIAINAFK